LALTVFTIMDFGSVVAPRIIWKGFHQTRGSFAILQFERGWLASHQLNPGKRGQVQKLTNCC